MKQSLLPRSFLLLALLISERSVAQNLPDVDKLMNSTTGAILKRTKDPQTPFITDKTLNHFAAKRQAYYLSGATTLSLFENFAIANVSDGTLQVDRNFSPYTKDDDLVNNLFTVAVQSNIANNVANLFSSNKLPNDVGIPFGFTHFFVKSTSVGLPDETHDKADLERRRAFQYTLLKKKMG